MSCSSIIMEDKLIIRSDKESVDFCFQILPVEDKQSFWINATSGIEVSVKNYDDVKNLRVLRVSAVNDSETPVEGKITVQLDNGVTQECRVTVLPRIVPAPRFKNTPEIVFRDGKAVVDYEFVNMGDNEDRSEISWYRVDMKDRSDFEIVNFAKKSNEKDCRKIAVSRNGRACKSIRLTSADIGKHIKVNIKPKHSNSEKGQGLNIVSQIVKPADVNESVVLLNPQTVVTTDGYDMEPGYFTVRGRMESVQSSGIHARSVLTTESMGCGIYYMKEKNVSDMSLVVLLDPECRSGNGFSGPGQHVEIYIKYDPQNRNGYALRIESTAAEDGKVAFGLYQVKNGNSTPLSEAVLSNAFKPGCEINLQIREDVMNAFITYDDGEDFSDVELRATIRPNEFGGFGFKFMAEPEEGYRCSIKYLEASYENEGYKM